MLISDADKTHIYGERVTGQGKSLSIGDPETGMKITHFKRDCAEQFKQVACSNRRALNASSANMPALFLVMVSDA